MRVSYYRHGPVRGLGHHGAMQRLDPGPVVDDPLAPYRDVARRGPDGRPWVLANMVSGLDGSTAIAGRVGALSSPADAELFRSMRAVADVVLVGAETVRREHYGPVRLPDHVRAERVAEGRPPVPTLAIVSRSLRFDLDAPTFAEADPAAPTAVVTCAAADPDRLALTRTRVPVVVAGEERVDPSAALAAFAAGGASVVLCEGGPTLLGELVAAELLDELCLTIEPLMGGDPLPVAVTPAEHHLVRFSLAHALTSDGTLFLRYERVTDPREPAR
jgi:riboflavin biosynthesis pyrimidine reductase